MGIYGCAVLGARQCQPPARAGCGAAGSQAEASQQRRCQTCAVPPHETNPCRGPARHVAVGLVLPAAEMLSLPSLYPSSGATCALRLRTRSWAQLLCGALHPPTPLATSAQSPGTGGDGPAQPSHGWGEREHPAKGHAACAQAAFRTPRAGLQLEPAGEHRQGGQGDWAASAALGGAGGTSELLIGSILALSFAMQATSPQCLWGPVRCKGEGAPSSSDLTNLTRPFLLPLRPRPSGYGSVGR